MRNAYGEVEYASIIQEMKLALWEERKKYGDNDKEYAIMQSILQNGLMN